jgi:hypothetical protein
MGHTPNRSFWAVLVGKRRAATTDTEEPRRKTTRPRRSGTENMTRPTARGQPKLSESVLAYWPIEIAMTRVLSI